MAYKTPKPAKSETCSAIFVRISLIAKWLCDGYLEFSLIAKWFWEILLIASFFGPEVQKLQFLMFHLNSQ